MLDTGPVLPTTASQSSKAVHEGKSPGRPTYEQDESPIWCYLLPEDQWRLQSTLDATQSSQAQ